MVMYMPGIRDIWMFPASEEGMGVPLGLGTNLTRHSLSTLARALLPVMLENHNAIGRTRYGDLHTGSPHWHTKLQDSMAQAALSKGKPAHDSH